MADGDGSAEAGDVRNQWIAAYQLNQLHAQLPEQGEGRRVFARMVFFALDGAEKAGYPKRNADAVRFNLRGLLIEELPPDGDPLWDPDALGADVLAALPLSLQRAQAWSTDWTTRPRIEILALRTCKNLLGSMRTIADRVTAEPLRTQVDQWLELWPRLP
ncbi:hypothetical protein [Streptosporangium lutulentum]|uniref:Uncharacterized protein n=1 Tax=Streptosporangium lutulentum TaxID=1461250 RepID=A0ABT9QJV1_9ACTN|nr:hypothetical protein [Streptosporangium lutulentum]MDP9846989.1 hypothetical protein [Streptosporangium lutulentum]